LVDVPKLAESEAKTVMVLDARPLDRAVLVRQLRKLGLRVVEAASEMDARRLAGAEPRIDLLLANLAALTTGEVELVRWFCVNQRECEVLVVTDSLWEVEVCLGDLPRLGVLLKPFTPARLARAVVLKLRTSHPTVRPKK